MRLADWLDRLSDGYAHDAECGECGQALSIVDRYASDYPPGPRGPHPESWVQYYADKYHDPDDLLVECPGCQGELSLDTVVPAGHGLSEAKRIEREVRLEEEMNRDLIEWHYVRGICAPDF